MSGSGWISGSSRSRSRSVVVVVIVVVVIVVVVVVAVVVVVIVVVVVVVVLVVVAAVAVAVAVAMAVVVVAVVVVVVVCFISDRIQQWYKNRKHYVNTRNAHNIETLLHSAAGHRGSREAHQAGNQKHVTKLKSEYGWNMQLLNYIKSR